MIHGAPVAIVVDGRAVASSQPALIEAGTVVVPLDPYLVGLTTRIEVDPLAGTITFLRDDDSVTIAPGKRTASVGSRLVRLPIAPYLREGGLIIPLAPVARGLGLRVSFDGRTRVLTVLSPAPRPLRTPVPYVTPSGAPTVAPVRVDATPTPRPIVTGIPRPRRTPIEVHQDAG